MPSLDLSSEVRRDPYRWYDQMRRVAPVHHDERSNIWMLFDYESAKRAMDDHATFGSRVVPSTGAAPEWLVFLDPPRHSRLRGLVSRAFAPRSIAALEPSIRAMSADLLAALGDRTEFDLVQEYATPLPVMVIAELMGIPVHDRVRFERWSHAIVNLSYSITGGEAAQRAISEYRAIRVEMSEYVARLVAERRAHPADDLLSRIAHAEVDGERLGDDDILGFFQLLLSAATETTTNLIANAMLCFLDHPEQLARLRADRSLLPSAIEEIVRFRSPGQIMFRQTLCDATVHDRTIPHDSFVLVMVGSANRDPRRFSDPDRFDIGRDPNPHIAFGHGIHACLGAALARLEARVALGDLLDRFHAVELASTEPWEPREALHVHGPARLALRRVTGGKGESSRA
jgi:cytochrome P450